MSSAFSSLPLNAALLANLSDLGFNQMTPVQAQSLPEIFSGRDLIAQSKTGSGKTVAFGLGLLHKLNVGQFRVQSLVLCPTRELADQVAKELRRLARTIHNIKILTLCGGMPFGPQIGSLEHGAHIIVGTPGRIEEHVRKGTLALNHVSMLVLDEADRMLDMGFQEVIDTIVEQVPSARQTLLFSATFPDAIADIAKRVLSNPVRVTVESPAQENTIQEHFYQVGSESERLKAVQLILARYAPQSTVVFCNTKRETEEVASYLAERGFSALALHGDLEQRQRDQMLVRFSGRSALVLVATDVAARGLDIDQLDAVINYHIAREEEVHTHRIGRTGRAGNKGRAFSLFSDKESHRLLRMSLTADPLASAEPLPDRAFLNEAPLKAPMATLQIDGGKKQKLRPGDIVGGLTGSSGIPGTAIGKIAVFDNTAYVAVERQYAKQALDTISHGKMKGRSFRIRRIR